MENSPTEGEPELLPSRLAAMRIGLIVFVVVVLAGCRGPDSPASGGGGGTQGPTGWLQVQAVAGPVCPVEKQPPDPACAARPVAGATVLVTPADGREILIARGTTDGQGMVGFDIAPGEYLVSGAAVQGLMGGATEAKATVVAAQTASVTLEYDTGIR